MAFIGKGVIEARFPAMFHGIISRHAFAFAPSFAVRPIGLRRQSRLGLRHRFSVVGALVEQRVALEFAFDIRDEIEIGELQELDRLHELRRHDQRLALADQQSLCKRHGYPGLNWSNSCL